MLATPNLSGDTCKQVELGERIPISRGKHAALEEVTLLLY